MSCSSNPCNYELVKYPYSPEALAALRSAVEVGCIVEHPSEETVLHLVYDPNAEDDFGCDLCLTVTEQGYPVVYLSVVYLQLLLDRQKVFYAIALMEYSRFLSGAYDVADFYVGDENTQDYRTSQILMGKVVEDVLLADRFAVMQVGKSTVMNALDFLMRLRQARPDDLDKDLALRELELRKAAVKSLK